MYDKSAAVSGTSKMQEWSPEPPYLWFVKMKKKALSDLVLLIRSMSKSEKRAFRMLSTRYKTTGASSKNYLRIYDEIARHPEGQILTDAKNSDQEYLLTLLIDSLAQQRRTFAETDLREQLSSASILHRRGLQKKALRLLDKLRLLAWEGGAYEFGLEVVSVHVQLLTNLEDLGELRQLVNEREKLLDALAAFHRYDLLMLELFSILRKHDNDEVRRFLKKILRQKPPADVRARIHYHHLLAHAYISLSDLSSSQKHHNAIMELFESHPLFMRMRTIQYIMFVLNSGILAWHARSVSHLEEALSRLRQPSSEMGPLQSFDKERITRYRLDLELRYHLLNKEPELNLPLAAEIRKALTKDLQMEFYRANYLRYFMALSLFYNGRFKEALHWLQPVIDEKKKGYYNQKIYSLAFLLRAACHYRQGNDDIGDSLLLGFRRNKFFSQLRETAQFVLLVKEIPKGYAGENWFL